MAKRSVLIVGGPDAGKTNYIVRLWLGISRDIGSIRQRGLPEDLEYLQAGAEQLLSGSFAPHTSREVYNHSTIPVVLGHGDSVVEADLVLPDYSGEKLKAVYDTRRWSSEWENDVAAAAGCLVFLRVDSDQIVAPLDWISASHLLGQVPPNIDSGSRYEVPTQVLLVEWLQFLHAAFASRIESGEQPRVGVVVSAWDLTPPDQRTDGPEEYLRSNFPLLAQYLRTTQHFATAVFGLSITGGDLEREPGYKARYLEGDPLEAGYVVHSLLGAPTTTSDMGFPVAWALGLDEGSGRSAN